MKKFYVLAAAAAVALSAAAQDKIYVVGAWGGEEHWNSEGMLTFEKTGDNYVFKIDQLSTFKLSTAPLAKVGEGEEAADDWETYNANCYSCSYGFKVGVEKELAKGDGNIAAPYVGDYTVTVAGDFSTIKLETETPNPGFHVYLRGGCNEWTGDVELLKEWEFKCVDETNLIYEYTFDATHEIIANDEFKVADATWGSINYGMPQNETKENYEFMPMEEAAVLVYNNGKNIIVKEDLVDGSKAFFNLATTELYLTTDPEAENPFTQGAVNNITVDNNAPAAYYTLQGVRVSEPANGLYIVVKDGKATKVIK